MSRIRDDKLRENIGMYENLLEDVGIIADMLIGNDGMDDYEASGEYNPFLMLLSEFHFSPENDRITKELLNRLKFIEKKVYNLRVQIDNNHKKAKFLYGKSQ